MVTICYHSLVAAHLPDEVSRLAGEPLTRRLTRAALNGCLELGLSPDLIWEVLASVGGPECRFIKTLDSDLRANEKLDVYDALVAGQPVYVKIKIVKAEAPERLLVVLSFKRNEYYERNMR